MKCGNVLVMEHENPYVMEAVQWIKTKANLRPWKQIANDAGMTTNNLRYEAMYIIAGRKSTGKRGRPRKTN